VFLGSALALGALLAASPASSQLRVMCYGDSITAGSDESNPANSYPGELQRLRSDFDVVNQGRDGDVSGNLDRFKAALAETSPDVVVLMLGTNDPVCTPGATPGCKETPTAEETATNLMRMADAGRAAGAKVIVVTPPPAVCKAHCDSRNDVAYAMWMRDAFTGRLADVLRRVDTPRGIRVADLRRRLSDAAWARLSTNGLHPSEEGNRMIARFVAAYIPTRGAPDVTVARHHDRQPRRGDETRSARSEPNPFARRPQDPRYTY